MIRTDIAHGGGLVSRVPLRFQMGVPRSREDLNAALFYADVQGHPEDRNLALALALEELAFFSNEVKILGVYPAHPYRLHGDAAEE